MRSTQKGAGEMNPIPSQEEIRRGDTTDACFVRTRAGMKRRGNAERRGILGRPSGIAAKTSRSKRLAGDRTVLSFGARRMHPALSTLIDRHAFVGGADGVSVVRSASFLGEAPQGTMPHALILVLGGTGEALAGVGGAGGE